MIYLFTTVTFHSYVTGGKDLVLAEAGSWIRYGLVHDSSIPAPSMEEMAESNNQDA